MKIRFLIDENLTPRLKAALWRYSPEIDVLRVGDEGAPVRGTLDPEILLYLETSRRLLVTDNRSSIPGHVADHAAAGRRHWGIAWTRPDVRIGPLAEALHLIWAASEAKEWIDRTVWIPF
jgi:hypothetical protein